MAIKCGYVVYMRLAIGRYDVYTNPKCPCTREMAESLAEHLRRNRTGSMIVQMPTGEIVQEVRI
jgi:fructose 1,6-bisphosphatase